MRTTKQEQVRKANVKYKAARRALIEAFKAAPCVRCEQEFPICAMDVHHPPHYPKTYSGYVSIMKWAMTVSVDRLREELENCEPMCANCHRIISFEEGQTG